MRRGTLGVRGRKKELGGQDSPEGRGAASVRLHGVATRTRRVSTGTARTRTRVCFSLPLSLVFCFLSPFFVVFLMCLLLPFVSSFCQSVLFMCSLLHSCSKVFLIVFFFALCLLLWLSRSGCCCRFVSVSSTFQCFSALYHVCPVSDQTVVLLVVALNVWRLPPV